MQGHCTHCETQNTADAKYCNQCGLALGSSGEHRAVGQFAERRQLTVMFCDLVASTRLARTMADEDYRDLLNEYQVACSSVVSELGGVVAQYLGDGVLVYFGYPEAHEDDPRRSTEAALRILERTKSLSTRLNIALPFTPQVRIGIHTGLVLVTKVGAELHESLALGETPHLASRLQQIAEPDSVVVSQATQKLIEEYFVTRSLGAATLKGYDAPEPVFSVLQAHGLGRRSQAAHKPHAALIGREWETAELNRQWAAVVDEAAVRAVLIRGEPGIGKSHQAYELKQRLEGQCTLVELHCSTFHQNAMLHPFVDAFTTACDLSTVAEPERRFELLQRHMAQLGLPENTAVPLAPVLSLPVPEALQQPGLPPQLKRQRMLNSLLSWLLALAQRAPMLLLIEDLQWADPSTLELLAQYVVRSKTGAIFVVATCRPELTVDWPEENTRTINLRRLVREHAERVIANSAKQHKLPATVVDRIIELTDGVPFYLEEVTKAILESDTLRREGDHYVLSGALPELGVPTTLHDSMMARLDRTADGRKVAQVAAVLGREFSERVLRAVWLMNEADLDLGLRRLLHAELIVPANANPDRAYRFKHALIQETAYQSLVKRRRQQHHHHAASVLRDIFPEVAQTQPHVIALHHSRANLPALAASNFERAGKRAFDAQAYVEAINHYENALSHLRLLPEDSERNRQELDLLTALGLPLIMTKGYAAIEVTQVYDRALSLCDEVNPPLRLLFGIWGAQISRGERSGAARMVAMFKALVARSRIPCERLIALAAIGSHAFWCGRIDEAHTTLTEAARLFEPDMLVTLPRDFGYDNPVYPLLYLTWAQHVSGRFADATATWDELWSLTAQAGSAYLMVMALAFGASVADDIGDVDRVLELSQKGMALAVEHQLMFWLATCRVQYGSAQCKRANLEEGIELIEQGVMLYRAVGAYTGLSISMSKLAEAYLRAGKLDKCQEVVDDALAMSEKLLDRLGVPELLRIKGLLLATRGSASAAETCFEQSIERARQSGAVLHELRCAVSFADWLSTRGELARAANVLTAPSGAVLNGDVPVFQAARELARQIALKRDGSPTPAALG